MKKGIYISILMGILLLTGCQRKYRITFVYEDGEEILSFKVEKGASIGYPTVQQEEGYYYEWSKTPSELTDIKNNIEVVAIKKECQKICRYYIDECLVKEETTNYFQTVDAPSIPEYAKNFKWIETKTFQNAIYYFDYVLEYDRKLGTIVYYDGTQKLDLTPNTYWNNETIQLPTYEKENAEFIGWFVSDLSLCRYNVYTGTTDGELVLYARFVSRDTPIELPKSMYTFTEIKKIPHSSGNGTYVYQPVMPNDIPIASVTQYDWSTSDTSIATVSAYSSITAKKAGFCVLTATLKTDVSVTINCLIKVSNEGVFYSTLEEANAPSVVEVTFVDREGEILEKQFVKEGQYAIPPMPPLYEGFAFCGWNQDIYNITEDTTIQAMYTTGINPYVGKKFAIIGDSISTYQDYIPEGYASFYPYPTADIHDVNQTWWMQSINRLGGSLFINNSYSGSCVSTEGSSAATDDTRLSQLKIGHEQPEVILIYMGSNDCASIYVSLDSFQTAYQLMIAKLKKLCPHSEIIVCTLPTTLFYSKQNQNDYNQVILDCATEHNLKIIHLDELDISNHLVDSAHPLQSGMNLIAHKVVEDILKEIND